MSTVIPLSSSRTPGRALLLTIILACGATAVAVTPMWASAPNEIYIGAVEDDLGEHLVDPDGRTLYVHAGDIFAGRSRCHGPCAEAWPPLTLAEGYQVEGEDELTGPVGVIGRPDGSRMVTYRGRPLYYHAADEMPGDARGHGAGDAWYVATVDGSIPPAASTPPLISAPPAVSLQASGADPGGFLTDGDGMTLYYFAGDRTPGVSACAEGCIELWPPLTVQDGRGVGVGDGIPGVVGLAEGAGEHIVTYDGRPLYHFAEDLDPGDTNGHGAFDAWYVAALDGSLPSD